MYHGKYQENKKKKKRRVPLGLRILLWTLAVLLVLTGAAYAYINILLDHIDRSEITGNAALSFLEALGDNSLLTDNADSEEEIAAMQGAFADDGELVRHVGSETILLVGSDTRG